MKTYIGIDPGARGAVAVIPPHSEPRVIPVSDNPAVISSAIIDAVSGAGADGCHAVVEDVHAMPGNGAVSMFRFGQCKGIILGALSALGIPYSLATPQTWQRAIWCAPDRVKIAGKVQPKPTSINAAQRLFPDVSLLASPRSVKPHDGMADALLIAEYARRMNL